MFPKWRRRRKTRKGETRQPRPPSFATTLPSAKLAWQWGREAGRERSVAELAASGYPSPAGEPLASLWPAGEPAGRAGTRRLRRRERPARGRSSGAVRPLSGPQGTWVTWGARLCPPPWRPAAPELIKRLFWRREASHPPGVGRVGAACGRRNNQPHSCASTKPAAQREVNSGCLNGSFKRRHLQARPVVN